MTIIRVIDFETTSADPDARVIEYGWSDYDTDTRAVSPPQSELFHVDHIPAVSRAVHHISLSDISDYAVSFDPAEHVFGPAGDIAYFAAHNAKFEAQFLGDLTGKRLICTYKAALRLWPDAPSHSNGTLRYWLEDAGKIEIDRDMAYPAHRAGPDVYIAAHLLKAMFEAGATGRQLLDWTAEPPLLPTCPIGEWRGKPWSEVDGGFLRWMVEKTGMEADLRWNARREIDRRA